MGKFETHPLQFRMISEEVLKKPGVELFKKYIYKNDAITKVSKASSINNVDLDLATPTEAVCSGYTLFAPYIEQHW